VTSSGLVSIVLPCFNAARVLSAALDSLVGQTYRQFEILTLDDGSTDATAQVLASYAARDARIRVIRSPKNMGLIATLNRGVAEARGEFIGRMDADDVSAPGRIERQVTALMDSPEIGLVGTGIELVGAEDGRSLRPRPVRCLTPEGARFTALLATPVAHVTIVARASVMRAHPYGLSPDSVHTEDYEMFTRMLDAGVAFLNLDEPLMTVRVDPQGVSLRHEQIQVTNFVACARRHLERTLGFLPDAGAHTVLVNRLGPATTPRDLARGLRWLDRIEQAFLTREPTAAREVRAVADIQRVDILTQAALKGAPRVRLAAAGLAVRYARRIFSVPARRYLATKV
jgi:glycosyltransferase involved in cell wall biosynthesis